VVFEATHLASNERRTPVRLLLRACLAEGRGLDPQCARHPIRFRRMPASRPVDLPCGGWRAHSKPMPCAAIGFQNRAGHPADSPSVFGHRALIGQGGRLRSCDLSVPGRGLYQTELHPVELALRTGIKPASARRQRARLIRCVTEPMWCAGSDLNRHDFSAASQTAASAISPPAHLVGRHLVDLAGIERALARIKNPPLNRSATGLLVEPGGLEPPATGLKVPCPADPGCVRSGSRRARV
jgi:hypothetical protein